MAADNLPLPLSFRAELLEPVFSDLQAGECCSLVGTSGTGKSNVARFLRRYDVQNTYLSDNRSWVIVIDSHSLLFNDEQKAEYLIIELMVHCLITEAEGRGFSVEFLTWANELYNRFIANSTVHFARRTLQDICGRLCEKHDLRLIFVFDQFDDLWQTLEARFFLYLRSLRDLFKYQVVYLVMTRDRLQRMRQDFQKVESFWELFSAHTYGLGPYSESDAATMVERLALRAHVIIEDVSQEIVRLSGGHSGILRAIFWAFRNSSRKSFSVDDLLQISSVYEECEKLWKSLSPGEQNLTQIIAQNLSPDHSAVEVLNDLQLKGIISGDPPVIFSPIFAAYVLRKAKGSLPGVVVNVRQHQVWLDGQLLKHNWSILEFGLLEYLASHIGTICRFEDLIRVLYGEPHYNKSDRYLLYAPLNRIRKALGEDAHNPRYLITQQGGIQLLQGGIINADVE